MDNFNAVEAAARLMALEANQQPMQHYAGMADNTLVNPRNQVPGMGSAANALPHSNPLADQRTQRLSEADYNALMSKIAAGAGLAALPAAPFNPFAALGAATGAAGAVAYDSARYLDEQAAKRLGYQGN